MENTTQTQPQQPDITLADLEIVKNIIDVASQRGAFKASELKDVGEAYNKLNNFIARMIRQNQEAAGIQESADQQPGEETSPPQGE
jgi:uncharacterized protein YigE (DUF2233 family)